ncbi:cardiolipin synthase [Marilutibacter alkalisoli]|uniref:Cardiolipin synthase n=1 Tax=Marilutibacter alkalisoli TaxID=2591633 RepID=A0A514BW70_9GAMM|nr:cardiolipin synthase [Lysobacter alkalisoli]QDH71555.1 cardiolipin synthase [Lysobacter alkalisoli]
MSWDLLSTGALLLALDWAIRLAALVWIPARTSPAAARSWLLLVFFLPLLGLPLYLLFGHPWLSRERIRRQALASQAIREGQAPQAALRWTPPTGGAEYEMAPLVERLGDFMPVRGNTIALLDDYDASLRTLLDDIDGARERVHLLYYLMFDDAVGEAVVGALERAAGRGVCCRLLLDAVGAKRGFRRYARRLRAAGVEVHDMLPGGLRWRRSGRMDLRNHRKIAVIDDDVAHVGSQNLAEAEFVRGFPNRELVARVRGPAVAHLEAVFASDWYLETGEILAVSSTRPTHSDDAAAQLLPSGPAYPFANARDTVNALIHLARHRLVLTTPYFVPDDAIMAALRIAALSGVEVQLILSASNNQRLTAWAQHSWYEELLACGVKVALYRPHFLHAKHMSVDDGIVLIGSINLDFRSFALNAEIGLLCYDRDAVARMRGIEAEYLRDSEQLSLEQWRRRPGWKRSLEGIARLADSFM